MWRKNRKNRKQRDQRNMKKGKYRIYKDIKSLPKEDAPEKKQYNFVEQIKQQGDNQNFNKIIDQEKHLQLQYHKQKQINLKNRKNYDECNN